MVSVQRAAFVYYRRDATGQLARLAGIAPVVTAIDLIVTFELNQFVIDTDD
jgi:hypothetical protein